MAHEQNKKLIETLANCVAECNHCISACLEEENVGALARCIRLDMDCAEICNLAIGYVSRSSEHAEHILHECADICEDCAKECEKHSDMEHCRRCAAVCRECAEACHSGVAA